eukprot:349898-Chlamydomonas_euryale.AAC.4
MPLCMLHAEQCAAPSRGCPHRPHRQTGGAARTSHPLDTLRLCLSTPDPRCLSPQPTHTFMSTRKAAWRGGRTNLRTASANDSPTSAYDAAHMLASLVGSVTPKSGSDRRSSATGEKRQQARAGGFLKKLIGSVTPKSGSGRRPSATGAQRWQARAGGCSGGECHEAGRLRLTYGRHMSVAPCTTQRSWLSNRLLPWSPLPFVHTHSPASNMQSLGYQYAPNTQPPLTTAMQHARMNPSPQHTCACLVHAVVEPAGKRRDGDASVQHLARQAVEHHGGRFQPGTQPVGGAVCSVVALRT